MLKKLNEFLSFFFEQIGGCSVTPMELKRLLDTGSPAVQTSAIQRPLNVTHPPAPARLAAAPSPSGDGNMRRA
jgi:hypothetical protein